MAFAAFDHLVVAAATLEQGEAYLEQRLGVHPQRGGKHVLMGTHNSLVGLGAKRYIEVIAIDPGASPRARPARRAGLPSTRSPCSRHCARRRD